MTTRARTKISFLCVNSPIGANDVGLFRYNVYAWYVIPRFLFNWNHILRTRVEPLTSEAVTMTIFSIAFTVVVLVVVAAAQTTITVDANTKYQTIDGFGFSQAFGRAKEFRNAASTLQKQALDYLFSTTTGAGFSIIRNRVGSGGSGDSILPTNPGRW